MKNVKSFLLMLLILGAVLFQGQLKAQVPPHGTFSPLSTSSNAFPFNTPSNKKTQLLYRPGDLGAVPGGLIDTLWFRNNNTASGTSAGPGTYSNLQVRLGQFSSTVFPGSGSLEFYAPAQLTTVINSPSYTINMLAPSGAWYYIPLPTPFTFDPTQTLVVDVEMDTRTSSSGFQSATFTTTPAPNHQRLTSTLNGATTGSASSILSDFGVSIAPLLSLDAAALRFNSPVAPLTAGQVLPVIIDIQNRGTSNLTTATVGYQINNNTPVLETWTGNLAGFITATHTFATSLTIPNSPTSTLKAWIVNANGSGPDLNTSNDTITRTLCLAMAPGTYTVGGVSPNFVTLQDAFDRAMCGGITGPIILSLAPGTYTGAHRLLNVIGAANASISIASAQGPASTILTADSGQTNQTLLSVSNTPNVSVSGLRFVRNTAPTGLSYMANFSGGNGCTVINNEFVDFSQSTASFNAGLLLTGSNHQVVSNTFDGFYTPIQLNSLATTVFENQNNVLTNTINNYTYRAITLQNQSAAILSSNTITNFTGISTAGAGISIINAYGLTIESNRITGNMAGFGITTSNLNVDTTGAGQNTRIYNNLISGVQSPTLVSTTLVVYLMNLSGSFSATATPTNPRDAVEIVNNTMRYDLNTASTSTIQAGVYFIGGSATTPVWSSVVFQNNIVEVNPITGNLPSVFRLMRFSAAEIVDSLISSNNNYRMNGTTLPAYFRITTPAFDYTTLADWQLARLRDANSGTINPVFLGPTQLVPTSTAFDNRGIPVSYLATDIQGATRSATTPDIGAYEFVGSIFSQINVTTLADTLIGPDRFVVASITDSVSTLVAGTARMFYKKTSQSVWQLDTVPFIAGNNYTFRISYASLGGVTALDNIQYYIAVRNATNMVTTAPLGGTGLLLVNATPPLVNYSYLILPVISGNYNVGVSGPSDFPTITAASNFVNNGLLNAAATFTLIDSAYGANEIYPIVLRGRPGSSAINTITIKPAANRASVVVTGAPIGTNSMFILENMKHFIWDGSNNGTSSRNLRLVNNSVSTTSAVIQLRNSVGETATNIQLKNLHITGNSNTAVSTFGIHLGGVAISTAGLGEGFSNVRFESNKVDKAGHGIYARGTTASPIQGIQIRNNQIGSVDTSNFIANKGIDLQNALQGVIAGNEIYNLLTTTSTAFAGIEIGGAASDSIRVRHNHIHDMTSRYFALPAVHGINVVSGFNAIITNNLIYGIVGGNYSNVSNLYNPAGIRLAGGSGHMVYYNSINLYGQHNNINTASASAPASLIVTSTVVTGLDIRNNIFANSMTSNSAQQSYAVAVWLPTSYSMASITLNNNAYQVDTTAQHFVGKVGTATTSPTYVRVANWKVATQVGNTNNDNASVPPVNNGLAPFISNTNLNIVAGSVTGIESGAVVIPVLGTPNIDYTGTNRPAGAGVGPDMGAYEFNGVALPDQFPPTIDSVKITPEGNQCLPIARVISVWGRDNLGGRGIDSVSVIWSVNTVAQPRILLTRTGGSSANGVWTGNILASANGAIVELSVISRDSIGNFSPTTSPINYQDDYLQLGVSNDTTILQGDTATLRATFQSGSPILITEMDLGGTDALEIQNVSGSTVNVNGWKVVVSNSYSDINSVNSIVQTLSGSMTPGQTMTWSDASTAPNYWGNNLFWNPGAFPSFSGWILVLKPNNEVVDAMFTSWPAANIQGAAINVGGTPVNLTGAWIGDGINTTIVPAGITVSRIGNQDNNDSTGYAFSPATLGATNSGLQLPLGGGRITWTTLAGTFVDSVAVIRVSPITTTTYIATITDGFCTKRDTVVVTVTIVNVTPDVGVSRFITPTSTTVVNGSAPIPVTVVIKNYGPVPATSFDIEYRVNGGASIVTNSITSTIPPGDSLQHTFTVSWTPNIGGNLRMCANTTGLPNEVNRANDTACVNLVSIVSVQELAQNNRLIGKVYPNPAESFVNFAFNEFSGRGILEIHDNLGRVVATIAVDRENGQVQTIRTDSWSAGMYSYRFIASDQVQHGNLVVNR